MSSALFKKIIGLLSCIALLIAATCTWFFNSKDIHLVFSAPAAEHIANQLRWNNNLNVEQTHNACGPYATMAYTFVKTGVLIDPEKINHEIGGRHGDGLTFPWGITEYLNQHNAEAHLYFLGL